jgi:hypothetical protein
VIGSPFAIINCPLGAADALVATTAVEARTKDVPTITATPTRRFLRAIIRALLGENRLLSVFIDLSYQLGWFLFRFLHQETILEAIERSLPPNRRLSTVDDN